MTTQARPDWNAEMDRQIKVTESAQALVNDHEKTIREQRQVIDQLRGVIAAADSGEWHLSSDCKVEKRSRDCRLCQALRKARKVLEGKPE
jgi:hypothetical protein